MFWLLLLLLCIAYANAIVVAYAIVTLLVLWLVVQLLTVESSVVLTLHINVYAMTLARVADAGGRWATFERAAGAAPEDAAAGASPTEPRGCSMGAAAPIGRGPAALIGS